MMPHPTHGHACTNFAITGNTILRSGLELRKRTIEDDLERTNVRVESCTGVSFTGNTLAAGENDLSNKEAGEMSPRYGMVLKDLRHCVVTHNTLASGASEQLINDQGGHTADSLVHDNPGTLISAL